MFNFSISELSASVRVFAGAAAAAMLVAASPASAASFFVGFASHFDNGQQGQASDRMTNVVLSPFNITGNNGVAPGSLDDFFAFCIQLDIAMGVGPMGSTINTVYADEATFSGADQAALSKLVGYGTSYFGAHPSPFEVDPINPFFPSDEIGAVQVAIWKITNPTVTVSFDPFISFDPAGNDGRASQLHSFAYGSGNALDAFASTSIRTVYARGLTGGFDRQGLAFVGAATGAVPEPMSWALMIMGFSAAGGMLRLSRRRALAA